MDIKHSSARNEVKLPGMLPIVEIGDTKYFKDSRLREYRNVDDFMDVITFDELEFWERAFDMLEKTAENTGQKLCACEDPKTGLFGLYFEKENKKNPDD